MYDIAKFIHIIAATCWAGGGITLMVMSYMARTSGPQVVITSFRLQRQIGDRWFMPGSVMTLISGVAMATEAQLWSEVWVVAGLLGYAISAATGPLMLKRLLHKAIASADKGDVVAANSTASAYLKAANFDYVIIGIVIALMVFKPASSDIVLLGTLAVLSVAAAICFLTPALRHQPSTLA